MSNAKIRQIAYNWHDGQWSPLYAFASSGKVKNLDDLRAEIAHTIHVCTTAGQPEMLAESLQELSELQAFAEALVKQEGEYEVVVEWAK